MHSQPEKLNYASNLPRNMGVGDRIRDAAVRVGGQVALAELTGISRGALSSYVAGRTSPQIETAQKIAEATGVTLEWIVLGTESSSGNTEGAIQCDRRLDADLMKELARIVERAHKNAHIRLPSVALVRESASLYNELVDRVDDPSDIDELRSLLPWAKARLSKRLSEAAANPGAGKRSA